MGFLFYIKPLDITASTLSASVSDCLEGDSVTFTLSTSGVPQGTIVPYQITGTNIKASDFTGISSLFGNFIIDQNGQSTLTLTVAPDTLAESTETFTVLLTDNPLVRATVNIVDSNPGASWDNGTSFWDDNTSFWDV